MKKILSLILCTLMICTSFTSYHGIHAQESNLQNVALGKPVTASHVSAAFAFHNPPERIVDGETNDQTYSHWNSGPVLDQQPFVIINLQKVYELEQIHVTTYADGTRWYQYEVEISEDGRTYQKVAEKKDEMIASKDGEAYTIPASKAQYVKIITTKASVDSAHIVEVQALAKGEEKGDNIALGKAVDGIGSNLAKITDGNKTTSSYWDSKKNIPAAFTIDLGSISEIHEIDVYPYYGAPARGYAYRIEVSNDDQTYTLAVNKAEAYLAIAAGEKYAFAESIQARYIRVTMDKNSNPSNDSVHMCEVEVYGKEQGHKENVAYQKPVYAGNGEPSNITDGNISNYWDGGVCPSEFEIDLLEYYAIDELQLFPYFGDGRAYHYQVYGSTNGRQYDLIAEKTDDTPTSGLGDTYTLEVPKTIRYLRVKMTFNSANPSVHMNEVKVYGVLDSTYEPPAIAPQDPQDPANIAYNKNARSNLNDYFVKDVVDGNLESSWQGKFYPSYVDIDLEENYQLEDIQVFFPIIEDRYYYYTVYGSVDGENFQRLYQKRDSKATSEAGDRIVLEDACYRILRVSVEYVSNSGSAFLSEVKVHGEKSDVEKIERKTALTIENFEDSSYAAEITTAETIENLYGIVDRTVGATYRDWFTFQLGEDIGKDYYTIENVDGKIRITGNDGVAIASGLNHYYKYYCKVNISETARQTSMPDTLVPVTEKIHKETPYEVRYAYNYCTLSYTFAFYDRDAWQDEMDWMALNGINVVMDLAGQEAVWIKFLMNFGYSLDEAKDWIVGPGYYAWQFMDNMETFGGQVADGWVEDRVELARDTQRWKQSLGIQTVMQGYAGMVPTDHDRYDKDIKLLKQGLWCGLDRPAMIRSDDAKYDAYAEMFYQAQREIYGAANHYYAVDPFHEGGIRPSDLSDTTIAKEVMSSLLKDDKNAVWMIQAWWSNPTDELLNGLGEDREDHAMVLDLCAVEAPTWEKRNEFNGTSWIYCMLENYGGNPSLDANLNTLATKIPEANKKASHMKGIGTIAEAQLDIPVAYDLLFEMAWESEPVDVHEWLQAYIERRYGTFSKDASKAWDILHRTVYNRSGNTGQIASAVPDTYGASSLPYSIENLQKAFTLLLNDFDELKDSEAYLYDLSEIMRQLINNYQVEKFKDIDAAFKAKDLETLKTEKQAFLHSFDILNGVGASRQETLLGEWIGKAEDWGANYDDYTMDSFRMNAKALLTTWAGFDTNRSLRDYAFRHYEGLIEDVYKVRWQTYLDKLERNLQDGEEIVKLGSDEYFHMYWQWNMSDKEYTRTASDTPEDLQRLAQQVLTECSVYTPDADNIAADKQVIASAEVNSPGSNGGYAYYVNDGSLSTYWDGGEWDVEDKPWIQIDLEGYYDVTSLQIVPYYLTNRYYLYDIYTSMDGEQWTKVVEKTSTEPQTKEGDHYDLEDVKTRYIKLVGLKNSLNESFHLCEIKAYGKILLPDTTPLQNQLDEISGLNAKHYTSNSWKALQDKVKEAERMIKDPLATQASMDAMLEELKALQQGLVVTIDLQKVIQQAGDLEAETYTTSTWHVFQDIVEEANALLKKADATQTELNEMIQQLHIAMAALEVKASAAQCALLKKAAQDALAMKPDYTPESYAPLQVAAQEALALLEKDANDIAASAVQNALMKIAFAKEALQSGAIKAALQITLNAAKTILASDELQDVRPGKVEALQAAVTAAEALLVQSDVRDEQYQAMTITLYKAMQELYKIVDKADLAEVIAEVKTLNEAQYTKASWNALMKAVAKAEALLKNEDATKDAVEACYDQVLQAVTNLAISTDKKALADAIAVAQQIIANAKQYVPSTIQGLQTVLTEATAVYEDEQASLQNIKKITEALIQENAKARLKADKHVLAEKVNVMSGMNLQVYGAGVEAFKKALQQAQQVLDKEDATQEEVQQMIELLENANKGLQLEKEGGTKEEQKHSKEQKDKTTSAATADTSHQMAWIFLFLVSGCVIVLKKRNHSN